MFSSNNNPTIAKIRYYFSFFIVALYVLMALVFLFTEIGIQQFPVYRKAVGVILLVYATFRVYSLIKANKKTHEDEE